MNQPTAWTFYRNAGTYTAFPQLPLWRRINWPVVGLLALGAGFWLAVIWVRSGR